jgi:hypothetical protein
MMGVKADLEIMGKLATTLHGLAGEAGGLVAKDAWCPDANDPLESGADAGQITKELVFGALVATAKQRLDETGAVMADCVTEFATMEDGNVDVLVKAYNDATGAWTVEPAK